MNQMLENYLKYTIHSESPQAYHKWTYLSMLAGIVGKKCFIRFNYFTAYPNLYIVLVSLPGVGKKSTAIRIGEAMVKESESEISIRKDSLTPQALAIELKEAYNVYIDNYGTEYGSSSMTLFASELITLLNSGQGMVEFLTDIYDSGDSWEYKTKNKGSVTIENPCVNVVGCMTTETFSSRILQDAVAGGFISRSIIIYSNAAKVISPFKFPDQESIDARNTVIEHFSKVKDICGEVLFTQEAKDYYEEWYMREFTKEEKGKTNMEFNSRKHVHVAKTAMLLAISDLTTTINIDHLKESIELLKEVEHYMRLIHMSTGGQQHTESMLKMLASINSLKEVTEEELLTVYMGDGNLTLLMENIEMLIRVGYVIMTSNDEGLKCLRITPKGEEVFLAYS